MIVLQRKSWQIKKRGSSKRRKIKSRKNGYKDWGHFYKQGNVLFSNTHVSHKYKNNNDSRAGILRNIYYCFSNTSCIKSVKDSVKDSGTHLWFSVWTDRLRVSSCVSISRVRLGLALWLLQHLGNRRPDGGCFCQRLRRHNKNAHWLIARKQSCYSGGATKRFGGESNTKPTNTTKLLKKKGNRSILQCGSLITQYTKRYMHTGEGENVHAESTFWKETIWSGRWATMEQYTTAEGTSLDPKTWTHTDLHFNKIKRLFKPLFLELQML